MKKAKSLRYKERQKADISLYGELKTERLGISEEELNELTPFRRLSKKPATLSDPEYFINQYQDVMKEYLQNWDRFENLSQAEQIDRIVKYRYGRLVANKIMNKIQKMPIEYNYAIGENGSIMSKDIGKEMNVMCDNLHEVLNRVHYERGWNDLGYLDGGEVPLIDVHNHPMAKAYSYWESIPEPIKEKLSKMNFTKKSIKLPFSTTDIKSYCHNNITGYVVDENGHKFSFIPKSRKVYGDEEDFISKLEQIEITDQAEYYDLPKLFDNYKGKKDNITENLFLESFKDYLSDKIYFDVMKNAEDKCGKFSELI